jgi:hypothetical protein
LEQIGTTITRTGEETTGNGNGCQAGGGHRGREGESREGKKKD